jgi:DNA-binding NtrC family response regulator
VRELRNLVERVVARRHGTVVEPTDLPEDLFTVSRSPVPAAPIVAGPETLFMAMVTGGESFWSVVYRPFMERDLTRQGLKKIIGLGLERTRGNYRSLVELFNMSRDDYKRFLNFLRKHDCQLPFHSYRTMKTMPPTAREPVRFEDARLRRGA